MVNQHISKALNRMVELVPSVKTAGKILYRDQNIFDPKYSKEKLRTNVGMVFNNQTHSLNQFMIISLMVLKLMALKQKVLDEIVEKSLRGAAIWDELKIDYTNAYGLSGATTTCLYCKMFSNRTGCYFNG